MRYQIQMDGREANVENAETESRYAMEVHADHTQEAKAIAIVRAQSHGIDVDVQSIEIEARRR
jgi:hypothetical protein